jgi:hypothetical protein
MEDIGLHTANLFFYVFHTVLIFFNLFGWLFARTRRMNLISLLTTFGSWIILGFWKGWGYCFLTDWHYDVLRKLGEQDLPSSYIAFLIQKLTGWLPAADLVDRATTISAILALLCSLWVNLRARK